MLTVLGDTHAESGHQLEGPVLEAVRDADLVVHTGDFTAPAVLDAFETEADDLVAVFGNNDPPAVRDRLPAHRVFDALGLRFLLVHGHEHEPTGLTMLARQEDADVAIVGHSHRPEITESGIPVVNPGSYAQPRWYRPAYATIERSGRSEDPGNDSGDGEGGGVVARLRAPDGSAFARARLEGRR